MTYLFEISWVEAGRAPIMPTKTHIVRRFSQFCSIRQVIAHYLLVEKQSSLLRIDNVTPRESSQVRVS